MTALLWLPPILAPLTGAGLALLPLRLRGWLLVAAPLPALVVGLVGDPGPAPDLSWLLLDVRLGLGPLTRILLVMTALLWAAAGASARPGPGNDRGFAALFLLTMTGNLGLLLAADAVSFYALFALMTVAAYGLVVHERSPATLRAGRVYVTLAILGEVAMFTGLALAVDAAGTTELAALGPAVAGSQLRDPIIGLALVGFGVKAGVVPLHVWLPLAHPAAPVPASAVLSGTMIKAGLIGWLHVLPVGQMALPGWAAACVVVGILSAYVGVVVGLTQRDAKANLAYSSISQMGMITVLVGVALAVPDDGALAATAAAVFALHHGFAKGALFLGVGVVKAESDPRRHRLLLAGMGLAALSLAGLPLTSGAVAKIPLKHAVGMLPGDWADPVVLTLSLAAGGTTMLMGRLLWLLARPAGSGRAPSATVAPWLVVLAAVAVATWLLPAALLADVDLPELYLAVIWEGLWPVLLGTAVVAVGWWAHRRTALRLPSVPAGDVVVPAEAVAWDAVAVWRRRVTPAAASTAERIRRVRQAIYLATLPGGGVDQVDRRISRWRTAGVLFVLIAAVLLTLLLAPGA